MPEDALGRAHAAATREIFAQSFFGLLLSHEKFLARETGTVLVLVVGVCRRRRDQLDGRAQLHCAK